MFLYLYVLDCFEVCVKLLLPIGELPDLADQLGNGFSFRCTGREICGAHLGQMLYAFWDWFPNE